MSKELDIGFFEPFRGNIVSCDSDGNVKVRIRGQIHFDKDIINEYFDNSEITFTREGRYDDFITHFSGTAKTDELMRLIWNMSYTITIYPKGFPS